MENINNNKVKIHALTDYFRLINKNLFIGCRNKIIINIDECSIE